MKEEKTHLSLLRGSSFLGINNFVFSKNTKCLYKW